MKFNPITTYPEKTDKYFISKDKGGYNRCIVRDSNTGFCLPNCVGFCYGAFMKTGGITSCNLSRGNAELWYGTNDGYPRGVIPKLGAIACWEGVGKLAGHVALVIAIDPDGTITCANSGYSSKDFWISKHKPPYSINNKYPFQGFIYNPNIDDEPIHPTQWVTGKYKLLVSKCIRKTHDLGNNIVQAQRCTAATKKVLTKKIGNAMIKSGTIVTITSIYNQNGRIWGKYGNCWLVLCNIDGTAQSVRI